MSVKPDDRVFHPTKKDWGVGKVLTVTPDTIEVFFVNGGHKKLSRSYVTLEIASSELGHHALLDNLAPAALSTEYLSLPSAIQKFLEEYPGGFYGQKCTDEERHYKVLAHNLATELLNPEILRALCHSDRFSEVCDRAKRVESATNLLSTFEKIQLHDALKKPECQGLFAKGLLSLLTLPQDDPFRFHAMADILAEANIATWPTATYFSFITHPESEIFIKPEVTKGAARVCAWEINYKSDLNWLTYKTVKDLFFHLKNELEIAGLRPRDMIDVQSFIWCIAEHK